MSTEKIYDMILLVTFHENVDCFIDFIENIKKFNKHETIAIIVSNGSEHSLDLDSDKDIYVIQRFPKNKSRYLTMIPVHIQLWDFVKENSLKSSYVLLLSSNQMFINHGFYPFIQRENYDAGYFKRPYSGINYKQELFLKYYNMIGPEHFTHQSNHDGMYFKYDIFNNMMDFFHEYKNKIEDVHQEEYLYYAYLSKHNYRLMEFSEYNHFCKSKEGDFIECKVDDIKDAKEKGIFIIKRIPRIINHPSRLYIKTLE